jgi:hypothetical protein
LPRKLLEGHCLAAVLFGQIHGALMGAIGHHHRLHAAVDEVLQGLRAHFAGADDQHLAPAQIPEGGLGQVHGGGADGHRAACDAGLGAGAFAEVQAALEQLLEARARRAGVGRRLQGGLDLRQDLALADNHAVEAHRDGEQVARGVGVEMAVDVRRHVARVDAVVLTEEDGQIAARGFRLGAHGVQLGAVAGGQDGGLAQGSAAIESQQGRLESAAEGHLFAHLDRRGAVVESGGDDVQRFASHGRRQSPPSKMARRMARAPASSPAANRSAASLSHMRS